MNICKCQADTKEQNTIATMDDTQPVVMDKIQWDKFGFQRGQCTAGTCTCEDFVMMKGTHGFKTCFPAPRNRQYYNKDYKNKPQQQLEQSSRSSLLLKNHQTQDKPTSSSTSTKRQQATAGEKILTMVSI